MIASSENIHKMFATRQMLLPPFFAIATSRLPQEKLTDFVLVCNTINIILCMCDDIIR